MAVSIIGSYGQARAGPARRLPGTDHLLWLAPDLHPHVPIPFGRCTMPEKIDLSFLYRMAPGYRSSNFGRTASPVYDRTRQVTITR